LETKIFAADNLKKMTQHLSQYAEAYKNFKKCILTSFCPSCVITNGMKMRQLFDTKHGACDRCGMVFFTQCEMSGVKKLTYIFYPWLVYCTVLTIMSFTPFSLIDICWSLTIFLSSHHFHELIKVNSARSVLINLLDDLLQVVLRQHRVQFLHDFLQDLCRDVAFSFFVVEAEGFL